MYLTVEDAAGTRLAGQLRSRGDPPLVLHRRRPPPADVGVHRHRPRDGHDVRRRPRARPTPPNRARAPRRRRPAQGHRSPGHPDLGPDRAAVLVRGDPGMGRGPLAGRRRDRPRPRVVATGGRPTAKGRSASTTPRTPSTRPSWRRSAPGPAPGAPVSVPIEWDELDDPDLRPDRWTIRDALERLATAGDPLSRADRPEAGVAEAHLRRWNDRGAAPGPEQPPEEVPRWLVSRDARSSERSTT